jgi:hypothetical protein
LAFDRADDRPDDVGPASVAVDALPKFVFSQGRKSALGL